MYITWGGAGERAVRKLCRTNDTGSGRVVLPPFDPSSPQVSLGHLQIAKLRFGLFDPASIRGGVEFQSEVLP